MDVIRSAYVNRKSSTYSYIYYCIAIFSVYSFESRSAGEEILDIWLSRSVRHSYVRNVCEKCEINK